MNRFVGLLLLSFAVSTQSSADGKISTGPFGEFWDYGSGYEMPERPKRKPNKPTLRVWLTESQQASRKVAETIIAHQTGSPTERAYNRTDFLEQRREPMEAWERFLRA